MPRSFQVPYDADGNLMHYARDGAYGTSKPDHWQEPQEQYLVLTMDRSVSGRSAKYFIWTTPSGRKYPMFATDMVHLAQEGMISHGKTTGWFRECKRGSNFGLRFVRE